jgi:hypothetical protein
MAEPRTLEDAARGITNLTDSGNASSRNPILSTDRDPKGATAISKNVERGISEKTSLCRYVRRYFNTNGLCMRRSAFVVYVARFRVCANPSVKRRVRSSQGHPTAILLGIEHVVFCITSWRATTPGVLFMSGATRFGSV